MFTRETLVGNPCICRLLVPRTRSPTSLGGRQAVRQGRTDRRDQRRADVVRYYMKTPTCTFARVCRARRGMRQNRLGILEQHHPDDPSRSKGSKQSTTGARTHTRDCQRSLVFHGRRLDHEVPEGESDPRVDHLEVALRDDVERRVGGEELNAFVVAEVGDLAPPRTSGRAESKRPRRTYHITTRYTRNKSIWYRSGAVRSAGHGMAAEKAAR